MLNPLRYFRRRREQQLQVEREREEAAKKRAGIAFENGYALGLHVMEDRVSRQIAHLERECNAMATLNMELLQEIDTLRQEGR